MKLNIKLQLLAVSTLLSLSLGCATGMRQALMQADSTAQYSASTPVVEATPPSGDFATDKPIFVQFTHRMDASTINAQNITISPNVQVAVTYDSANRIAYLKPAVPLANNTQYLVTVSTRVKSEAGVALPAAHSFAVTTRASADSSIPSVILLGQGCVATGATISVQFDEDMDSSTINSSTFTVAGVTGTVTYDASTRTAVFTPSAPLTAGTMYTVTVSGSVMDQGGVSLGHDYTFTFTTCTTPGSTNFCSYTKGGYQGGGTPGQIFDANFTTVFADGLTIGVNDGPGPLADAFWSADATGAAALKSFLTSPAKGPSTALPADYVNLPATTSGQLAEQVAALTLNVHFAGSATMPAGFGDLTLQNTGTSLDGATINAILAMANEALAGNGLPAGYTYSSLNDLIDNLNQSFDDCNESGWAQQHLK